jgi:hypothetical protein
MEFFMIGLIPMWLVVVFSIIRRRQKSSSNWLDKMIAECPNPTVTGRVFKTVWFSACTMFGLSVITPDSATGWAGFLSHIGRPGILIAFYSAGFLNAWAEWNRCHRREYTSTRGIP